ncbi:patatin-like phospholipase domain-containing protein 4 isoform X10 [Rhinatrema bivittatum]|uniref:patatin-like phospholipase domain-containing protein 4 isoform X10 n=1 Tax=Rhinatrema bivittatum TaxID=194408 RepID=UPI00112656E3|nr:patatin-like phospholipase domain-containing protein 4 isoform X10 [Rhinatrema bivittatum]
MQASTSTERPDAARWRLDLVAFLPHELTCCIRNTESVLGSGFHTSVAKIQFLSILQDKQTTIELLSDPSISTHLCNLHTTFNLHLFFISVQRMQPLNLSFAACGFLGIYHLGAAAAFLRHGKRMLQAVKAFAGASSGSLVATVLLTAPEKTKVLLASSFLPVYAGIKAMEYKGELSVANLERFIQALFPPRQEKMESLFQNGFDDAVQFLMKENWFEK